MSQQSHVLRCFKCETFQADIVKKSSKWVCKLCGEKQSLKIIYGKGTGKECRLHVQKLNVMRMTKEAEIPVSDYPTNDTIQKQEDTILTSKYVNVANMKNVSNMENKWSKYLNEDLKIEQAEQEVDGIEYVFEQPQKRKRTNNKNLGKHSKKSCMDLISENAEDQSNVDVYNENIIFSSKIEEVVYCHEDSSIYLNAKINENDAKCNFSVDEVVSKKVVLKESKVDSKSKWAKFIDKEDDLEKSEGDLKEAYENDQPFCVQENERKIDFPSGNIKEKGSKNIFESLKDENTDLDDIFNF